MLAALPNNDRRGASAWALVKTQCDQGNSDLQLEDIRADFINASIEKDIGYMYSEETITQFAQLLNSINWRLPNWQQFADESSSPLSSSRTSSILIADALALEAVTEIDAAGRPEPGSRRVQSSIGLDIIKKARNTFPFSAARREPLCDMCSSSRFPTNSLAEVYSCKPWVV